ncbi:hypothetical protein [Nitrospira sp. BLG_1]|uniref:hypothetical protein n=1 Tax=Nitrospira sp. BLG_1 TaxID=3395883 RepID=UPI0039BC92C2
MTSKSRGGLFAFFDRRTAARLLGAPLPRSARDVRYLCWQPSGDLAYQEALVRFDTSMNDYQAFVLARGLTPFSVSGPNVHLPIDWSSPREVAAPDWWQPSAKTPADAASGQLGVYGSIAVKWENGRAYALIVDTGHRAPASPGP